MILRLCCFIQISTAVLGSKSLKLSGPCDDMIMSCSSVMFMSLLRSAVFNRLRSEKPRSQSAVDRERVMAIFDSVI